jgi:hypothetical protein
MISNGLLCVFNEPKVALGNVFFWSTLLTPLDEYKHRFTTTAGKPCRFDQAKSRVGRVVVLDQLTWLELGCDCHQFSVGSSVPQELTMSKQLLAFVKSS